ncbi:MAG: thioesterase [Moraxellaceae bacterium]|nr:MAG: thioesterase [Moraxellaceae bacterium]
MVDLIALQALYDAEISLVEPMQLKVVSFVDDSLTVRAPLECNKNHHGTAFGGSLYCGLLLAGWGHVHLLLEEAGLKADIVVSKAEIKYRLPVAQDFEAYTVAPKAEFKQRFLEGVGKKGRGKLELTSRVDVDGKQAAALKVQFTVY